MGWFNKKKEGKKQDNPPELPELPKLPEIPNNQANQNQQLNNPQMNPQNNESLPQLPSYPNSDFGNRISQDAIKSAVSGEEEGDFADDSQDGMMQTAPNQEANEEDYEMTPPTRKPMKREFDETVKKSPGKNEPVFIRIDKFEESLDVFEKSKQKISEIENMLDEIKKIREEEEKELQQWEEEIQKIKGQFEKIDKDLFSKV